MYISPGPTAPLHWMRDCVEELIADTSPSQRAKLLVGLNFYGYDFGPSEMDGKIFVQYNKFLVF